MFFLARLALRAASALVVCLLAVGTVEAAPSRSVIERRAAKPTTIHKVMRRLKALSTPGVRMRRARAGLLFDFRPRLHRSGASHTDDDGSAIQNDGPVTILHTQDRAVFDLRPVGIVVGPTHSRCATLAFSPRSPRGPPLSA
jgi:hypothetical protein